METTLQQAAESILEVLSYDVGKMPHVVSWCKFVTEYTTLQDFCIDGMFNRVYRKPRRAPIAYESDLGMFRSIVRYTTNMTEECLRMISLEWHATYCVRCGDIYVENENTFHLCDKCFYTTVQRCAICNEVATFDEETLEAVPGMEEATYRRMGGRERIVCKSCADDASTFVKCDCCGNVVHRGDTGYGKTTSTGHQLRFCKACQNDRQAVLCPACNKYVLAAEVVSASGYCLKCHLKLMGVKKKAEIHSHTYKPSRLIFISTSPVIDGTYGLEIEVDDGHHSDELMEYLEELREMIRLKSDGSLNDGFEVVTFPMTLDFHRTVMPYEEMFRRLHDDGYTSHENSTCGLHIHAGRTGFGSTARSQNPAIGRMIWIVEAFKEQIKVFSRRKDFRYCQFYGFSSNMTPKDMLKYARIENRHSRYKAINLQNSGTVEIRIFKGSLKTSTVLASIELCDYIRKYVTKNKDDSTYNSSFTWQQFISGVRSSDYPNLRNYLVTKRLI